MRRNEEISTLRQRLRLAEDELARLTQARTERGQNARDVRQAHQLRREAESARSTLEGVLESVSDVVMGVSGNGRITYLNSRAAQHGQQPKDDCIGRELTAIFPGEVGTLIQGSLSRALRENLPTRLEYFSKPKSSWFETRIFPTAMGAVIFSADVSPRKYTEQQLKAALARLNMASEIAMLGFWQWDTSTDSVYFSPEWKKQLGYGDAELPNRIDEWTGRLHPDDKEAVLQQVERYVAAPSPDFETEYRLAHKEGGYRWINARWTALSSEEGTSNCFVVTHLDVTGIKQEAERLGYVASHDTLTGLPNRSLIHEFAGHVMNAARRRDGKVAILFFDLDRFKDINDTHGHKVGDRVLQEAAQRIARSLRAEDLVGRLGGDEFVAVLGEVTAQNDVSRAAAHCLESLRRPYLIDTLELQVAPSIGISLFPDDGESLEALMHNADSAMYEAKREGGGKFRFFAREGQLNH